MKRFLKITIPVILLILVLWGLFGYVISLFFSGAAMSSKVDIVHYVTENYDLVSQAAEKIKSMYDVDRIGLAPKGGLEENKSIKGLYAGNSEPGGSYTPIDDPLFKKIFDTKIVKEITVNDNIITFECGNRNRKLFRGFYYSLDGKLYDMDGLSFDFVAKDNGWSYEDEDCSFYIEQISDNWYFYEEKF